MEFPAAAVRPRYSAPSTTFDHRSVIPLSSVGACQDFKEITTLKCKDNVWKPLSSILSKAFNSIASVDVDVNCEALAASPTMEEALSTKIQGPHTLQVHIDQDSPNEGFVDIDGSFSETDDGEIPFCQVERRSHTSCGTPTTPPMAQRRQILGQTSVMSILDRQNSTMSSNQASSSRDDHTGDEAPTIAPHLGNEQPNPSCGDQEQRKGELQDLHRRFVSWVSSREALISLALGFIVLGLSAAAYRLGQQSTKYAKTSTFIAEKAYKKSTWEFCHITKVDFTKRFLKPLLITQ